MKESFFLGGCRTDMVEVWGALLGWEGTGQFEMMFAIWNIEQYRHDDKHGEPRGYVPAYVFTGEVITILYHFISRIHQERIEYCLENTLRTYSDTFLFKSIGFLLSRAPRAKHERSMFSIAKANKQNTTKLELLATGWSWNKRNLHCLCKIVYVQKRHAHRCPQKLYW